MFTLLFVLPIILIFLGFIVTATIGGRNPIVFSISISIITIVFIGVFFGWFYALGANLNKKLPDHVRMNLTRFKIFLFIPAAYIFLLSVLLLFKNILSSLQPNPAIFSLIIPMQLFCMFCMFYCLYFNAKSLKTVEMQRQVTFSDYAGEFFLIWLLPIGIWIIQPRINKIFNDSLHPTENV